MRGQHFQVLHLGAHRYVFAVDFNAVHPTYHGRSACAASLEPCEQDRVLGIRSVTLEMVQDPASCRHSTCRDDDLGHGIDCEGFRLLDTSNVMRDRARFSAFALSKPMISNMPAEDFARVYSHGAVKENWNFSNAPRRLQTMQVEHKTLCPPNGEGRNDDGATPSNGAADDFSESIFRIPHVMPAITVGRFDYQIVGAFDLHRVD